METDRSKSSEHLNRRFRKDLLTHIKSLKGIDDDELSLFEWYVNETEVLYSQMYATELEYLEKQNPDSDQYNDSGMVPVGYFIKRSRYSHVIYLASLGEAFLSHACWKLTAALGDNIVFGLNEITGKDWAKERRFLERYGKFEIPDELWNRLSLIYVVRNALAHENGAIGAVSEEERDKVRKKYQNAPGIDVEGYEISIQPEFVAFGVKALREFIEYLTQRLAVVIDRSIKPRGVP